MRPLGKGQPARRAGMVNNAMSVVMLGKQQKALELAEKFNDFRTIVELVHGGPDQDLKLTYYFQCYGQDFAETLYEWYIEQGIFSAARIVSP
jgi:hypothetical protein